MAFLGRSYSGRLVQWRGRIAYHVIPPRDPRSSGASLPGWLPARSFTLTSLERAETEEGNAGLSSLLNRGEFARSLVDSHDDALCLLAPRRLLFRIWISVPRRARAAYQGCYLAIIRSARYQAKLHPSSALRAPPSFDPSLHRYHSSIRPRQHAPACLLVTGSSVSASDLLLL